MAKRIVVIGAGASGMACAEALSAHPNKFQVTIIERAEVCGGVATSYSIDEKKFGATYINDGVQGCSPEFHNATAIISDILGFHLSTVEMQVSFGRESNFWTNAFPTDTIKKYSKDIKKFGWVLKVIQKLEPVFGLISVKAMLKIFRFSPQFGDVIVYPLVALFMGTGQQTPYVSAVILERLFLDPSMKLFDYSSETFLANVPSMRAFPKLHDVYASWASRLRDRGVTIYLQSNVTKVERNKEGVKVHFCSTDPTSNVGGFESNDVKYYDEIVFACDADSSLKILGDQATLLERKILGNVKYLRDVSVTHYDKEYMEKYYQMKPLFDIVSPSQTQEEGEQAPVAGGKFEPLYFVRTYPSDRSKIEMSFDLTSYQPQFGGSSPAPQNQATGNQESPANNAVKRVYQTIFLDAKDSSHLWSKAEINPNSVILEKWWKQQSHRWQHYAGTVPWMMWINGKNRTHFAGAWSLLNMHEVAIVSGFAAAYRLGADYPFNESEQSRRLFTLYLAVCHGSRMRKEDRNGFFA